MTVESGGEPVLYLDTNVLLDVMLGRRPAAESLCRRIRESKWAALTSPFSVMESLEAMKADRWAAKLQAQGFTFWQIHRRVGEMRLGFFRLSPAEIQHVYEQLHDKLSPLREFIGVASLTPAILSRAEDICASSNIETTDAIHLATALEAGCNIIISSDANFMAMADRYLIATTPETFDKALTKVANANKREPH